MLGNRRKLIVCQLKGCQSGLLSVQNKRFSHPLEQPPLGQVDREGLQEGAGSDIYHFHR
jgi:hypothetical protein